MNGNGINPRASSTGEGKAGITAGPNAQSVMAPVATAPPQDGVGSDGAGSPGGQGVVNAD